MNKEVVVILNLDEFDFFNPSPNFREMMILKLISKNSDISQEKLSKNVGIVPSMVNRYLKDFEDKGFLLKLGENKRIMQYELTESGKIRLQFLIVSFVNEVSKMFSETKNSFLSVLDVLEKDNIKKIFLYGAGVIGGTVLKVLNSENLEVAGFIDDSLSKQGDKIHGITIYSPEDVSKKDYDAVIIASFRHSEAIMKNAVNNKIQNIYIFKIDDNGNVSMKREG
jgi:predicted transcriptional regulator